MISIYILIPILILSYIIFQNIPFMSKKSNNTQTPTYKPTNIPSNIVTDSMQKYINNVDTNSATGDILVRCSGKDVQINGNTFSIKSSSNGGQNIMYVGYGSEDKKLGIITQIISPNTTPTTIQEFNTIIVDKMMFKVKRYYGYSSPSIAYYDVLDIGYIDNTNSPQPIQTPSSTFSP